MSNGRHMRPYKRTAHRSGAMTTLSKPFDPHSAKSYDLQDRQDWSSPVFIKVYDGDTPFRPEDLEFGNFEKDLRGCILVKRSKPKHTEKLLNKLPAGHRKKPGQDKEPDLTPLDTAIHEVESETGIVIPAWAFTYLGKSLTPRKDHWKCWFTARIRECDTKQMNLEHPENEGVIPRFVTITELYKLITDGEFIPDHYENMVKFGMIEPLD